MNGPSDLKISLNFPNSRVPADILSRCLDIIEFEIFLSELADIDKVQSLLPEVPPLVFDATRYQISRYRGKALLLEKAEGGSLILGGVVAGLTIWLLSQTLGETLKDAWKESNWHKKLKSILSKDLYKKADIIAQSTKEHLFRDSFFQANKTDFKVYTEERDQYVMISINVYVPPDITPPTTSEADK